MAGKTGDPSDALFSLPLEEFVAARNRLAAELGRGGDKDRAASVKALGKPSLSAWAANQLYWRERPLFDALAAAGAAVRRADGAQLRAALEARRAALQAASRRAGELLAAAGSTPAPEMVRRVSNTLEAITTLAPSPDTQPGRLTRDVDPPGFDALAGLAAAAAPSRVLPFRRAEAAKEQAAEKPSSATAKRRAEAERQAALFAARQAVKDAEANLRAARRDADRARQAAERSRAAADQAENERRTLEEKLSRATATAQTSARTARELERQVGVADQAVGAAEVDLTRARARLPTDE
jgi:hypothetical protein